MILAIETTGDICGVALHDGNGVVASCEDSRPRIHDEALSGQIRDVLDRASITIRQLDAIACSIGPGSFTGIRIGLSFAKGLCHALEIPIVAVPTLDAMANNFRSLAHDCHAETIVAGIKAEGKKWYCGVYDANGSPRQVPVTKLQGDTLSGIDQVVVIGAEGLYFTVEGRVLATEQTLPRPQFAAEYGSVLFARGILSAPAEVEPLYVTTVVHATL